jgi:hypothetical protein
MRASSRVGLGLFLFLTTAFMFPASAQELEPRAFRSLPTGLNFFVASYQISRGNVLFDATAPIDDLEIEIHSLSLAYMRTFGLAGRSASISVIVPRLDASASASAGGQIVTGSRNDWADARIRFAVNLLGGPAMSMQEFAQTKPGRTLGVGLTIAAPTGQYDSEKVINFGTNRWGFKPELGYSGVKGRWILDTSLGVWLFTENPDGPGGNTTVQQDPILSWQGHVSYNFKNRMWLALDLNYFDGGEISVGDQTRLSSQSNSRVGLTLSIPIKQHHSIRIATATGAFTRVGADFDVLSVAYQYRWGH